MEGSGCTQETIRGTYPTTDTYRVKNAQIEIIHKCRQLIDIDEVGQSSARPNASKLYLSSRSLLNTTGLIIQFLVGIKDNETGELWNCNVKSNRKLVIDNGTFSIEVEFEPNALALFPPTDCKGCQLPQYMGNVKCFLPVESDDPAVYMIRLKLFQHKEREKNLLDYMQFYVRSHEHGHDLFDYQEGRSITEVERPQMKIKMAGILAKDIGRSIAIHFQSLGDNGLHQLFEEDKMKLIQRIDGIAEYQDLNLSVMLEESILQFEQNKTEQCLATAMKVKELALETNSANAPFLIAKAYYVISAIYRQAGDFEKAKECMEISTEVIACLYACVL